MSGSGKITALFTAALLCGCATGPSGETFDSPIGEWSERFEMSMGSYQTAKLTIIDETSGVYSATNYPGKVEFYAVAEPREWQGHWINDSGSNACLEEKGGSKFWGDMVIRFNETYNRYNGYWNFCGEGTQYSLEGLR